MAGLPVYLARRLLLFACVLWSVLTIMFLLFYLLPGDPMAMFIDASFSPEMVERQQELWGLNHSMGVRYLQYLRNMLAFDFGDSFFETIPVQEIIVEKLLNTFLLIIPPLILSIVGGIVIGTIAGWRRGSRFERATVGVSLLLHSVPSFFAGILALTVFAYGLRWFPTGGIVSRTGPEGFWAILFSGEYWYHLALPGIVLVSREITGPILLMRSAILEVKGQDFLDVLKAKGLPPSAIVAHAARNAMLPMVSYVALMAGMLFQGQVLLEIVFSWPGIGRELVQALSNLDYPVAQAILFIMALSTLAMNFLSDLANGFVDPRVTYE